MKRIMTIIAAVSILTISPNSGLGGELSLVLGPEEIVEANGVDIDVGTYSVPSYVDWDNDGLNDLVIGTGSGYVHVYLNIGTQSNPQFFSYFRAQSDGNDLYCPPSGCMGCFPRVVYWDSDARKDLLAGHSDGTVKIFLNIGTDSDPCFDGGTLLQVGPPGSKVNIDVGERATSTVADWNSDGRKDLVIGALDGQIHLFINEGTDTEPNFIIQTFAKKDDSNLIVPSNRSSPVALDLDDDGKKDLLTGNTDGKLLFYSNVGTDADPCFSGYSYVEANGVEIYLGLRSRPFVCDWTGDNYLDVLIGSFDGKVHLYQGLPFLGDFEPDGDVDFVDFAVFAPAWLSAKGGQNWNPACDISDPNDGIINTFDLAVFCDQWLKGCE
jgi:hypothetical protein